MTGRICLALLFLAACRSAEPVVEAVSVIDSAGVRIVSSTAPAWGSSTGWHLDTVPDLTIGDAATLPSVLLVSVTGVRQRDNGVFVVSLDDEKAVRWFDGTGRD
jgi:hypothetical protein